MYANHEVTRKYPWLNNSHVTPYLKKYTPSQWDDIAAAGFEELCGSEVDSSLIVAFLQSISVIMSHPEVRPAIEDGSLSFFDIVNNQLKIVKSTMQQQSITNPSLVIEWLGPQLSKFVEVNVSSYAMMDDIVTALSDKKVRVVLSGDIEAFNSLVTVPAKLATIRGQDVRRLILTRQMSLQELIDLGNELSNKSVIRLLPTWAQDSTELKLLANEFTDEQLAELSNLLSLDIMSDRELKCSFLRTLLISTDVDGQQNMKDCPDIDIFRRLVLKTSHIFNSVMHSSSEDLAGHISDSEMIKKLGAFSTHASLGNYLIRKYLKAYNSVHVPIPDAGHERDRLLETVLRNIANQGKYWDLILILTESINVNSQNLSAGQTALHLAAIYASNHSGKDLCYKVLLKNKDVNPEIVDNNGCTAREYLPPSAGLSYSQDLR